jgi:hypothetical protein
MTNDPRKPQDESKLEQELAELRAAWQGMTQAEPPDLVDRAVLNAARRDLEPSRKRHPLRWLGGFATAAVVVLALTLVIEQQPQSPAMPAATEKSRPSADAADEQQLEPSAPVRLQAPLPPAEPRPMAREARRDTVRLKAAGQDAITEKAEAGTAQGFESRATAAPPAAVAMEAEAFSDEALEEALLPEPEAWIEQLLELQAKGEAGALEAGITAFRAAYPDYALPPELAEPLP